MTAGHATSTATVQLQVRRLSQLFNSLDPSPFWDRDLDRDAAEFIEDEFSDRGRDSRWRLCISTFDPENYSASDVTNAIRRYYDRMVESTRRRIRERLWVCELGLALGLGVFLGCLVARELLSERLGAAMPRLLDEGLIVLAWIALWLPTEQFFYELAPLVRSRRFYRRLAGLEVQVLESPRTDGG